MEPKSHLLEEYAFLSDGRSGALVHSSGAIDWMCWPRFDSPALFASLIGRRKNGHWTISPKGHYQTSRRYDGETLVLETEFLTESGQVKLTDWLSIYSGSPTLHRRLSGQQGTIQVLSHLAPRFDYGSIEPWIQKLDERRATFIGGPFSVDLVSPYFQIFHGSAQSDLLISAGDVYDFILAWRGSDRSSAHVDLKTDEDLQKTKHYWSGWAAKCAYNGPKKDLVKRSLLTLKSLIYRPSGGIVAAPTAALPEEIGGERNWDYRYCWIRDATFTLDAFLRAGYIEEAEAWRRWLIRAVAGTPRQVNIVYGVEGERRLTEISLDWLTGYENSRPVRIGNAAYKQRQHDIFGELIDVMHLARKVGLEPEHRSWIIQKNLVDFIEKHWSERDEGIWETRGPRQHFTHSKVMAWVALDRAIKACESYGLVGDLERWKQTRRQIHEETCRCGFNSSLGSFTQVFGGHSVDASLLLLPLVGFLSADDPRIKGTFLRINTDLVKDGLVFRYRNEESNDGLSGDEGALLPCSYWLIDNHVLRAELDQARELFDRVGTVANDLGLLSEEYDTKRERLIGNFPQALTHISLVNTAYNIEGTHSSEMDRTESRKQALPKS